MSFILTAWRRGGDGYPGGCSCGDSVDVTSFIERV